MIGTSLGPYKIIEQLGAGGMGEVYLGEDTRLGRKVAIKVLPPEFASDPERLARFEQEARAAAALNHPHIAAVFDVGSETAEGSDVTTHFMVQEYLEGQNLRERLERGALPLDRALDLATEIGEALIAAHKAGIIHRDLKPDNIFVTEEGHAKVLDFGLAKLTEVAAPTGSELSMSPTMLGTVAGQVMGTAGYMAPEQVNGEEVDQRADLFAFGSVLYETTTGRRAFVGKNVHDTLSRIISEEPVPVVEIDSSLPLELQRIVRKVLGKTPDRRYQNAVDMNLDLRQLRDDLAAGVAAAPESASQDNGHTTRTRGGLSWNLALPALAAAVALTAVGVWLATRPEPAAESAVSARFEIEIAGGDLTPVGLGLGRRAVAISPDGTSIVFLHDNRLWLRRLDELEKTEIQGAEGARSPFFSPDGNEIAFHAGDEIRRTLLTGGTPRRITGPVTNPYGASWSGTEVFYGQGAEGIFKAPAAGGEAELVVGVETGQTAHGPQLLPGGEWLLFTLASGLRWDEASIWAQSIANPSDRRELVRGGRDARFVPTGHLVYARDGGLFAAPLDLDTMETGEGTYLIDEVADAGIATGAAHFAVSDTGVLVYRRGGSNLSESTLVWLDDDGSEEELGVEIGAYHWLSISPDGRKIAVTRDSEDSGRAIWVWDTESRQFTQVTFGEDDSHPLWDPDGQTIYFASARTTTEPEVHVTSADGTGQPRAVHQGAEAVFPAAWAPDGRMIGVVRQGDRRDLAIMLLDAEDSSLETLADTPLPETYPSISPDGNWLAYLTEFGPGRGQVFVQRVSGEGERVAISPVGGYAPMWSLDGSTLYYDDLNLRQMVAVSLRFDPEVSVVESRPFADSRDIYTLAQGLNIYDVSPIDGRLLMLRLQRWDPDDERALDPKLIVSLNWFEELKERVPTGGR